MNNRITRHLIMKRLLIIFLSILPSFIFAKDKYTISTQSLVEKVVNKGLEKSNIKGYEGSLLLQGLGELSIATSSDSLKDFVVDILERFGTREIKGGGSFYSYEAGGNAAAYFNYIGVSSLAEQVAKSAKRMLREQKRSSEGLIIPSWVSMEKDQVFIDMAFAVSPYLLYAGLVEKNQEYIDFAVFETLKLFEILKDNDSGLLHQGRGFVEKGIVSEDNWSRGNGWGALAIAALAADLPKSHPQRKKVEETAKEFYLNVLKYQDENGVWHQEMTDFNSYAETSGTGLLLYGLGKMIESKVLGKKYMANFRKGINGLIGYIAEDGSVANACWSCLCPNHGTKQDYINHPTYYNDSHAFGPVVLALAEAINLGMDKISSDKELGYAITQKEPRTYVRFISEREEDIAWENDRAAFRVYSRRVKNKVSSGVDYWTKYVAHPVIDNWYALNAQGKEYHIDRGEGYDFYAVGRLRGIGGTGVVSGAKMYVAEPYANYRILKNDENLIEFKLDYQPYLADSSYVYESKVIRMVNGTNFYQVTSIFESDDREELLVAVGLTNFGKADVVKNKGNGLLNLKEEISAKDGSIGSAVVVDPSMIERFDTIGKDEVVILRVTSGKPFTYYVGAGWSKDPRYVPFNAKWDNMVKDNSFYRLNDWYETK